MDARAQNVGTTNRSCPNCAGSDLRRSHRRNVLERYILRMIGLHPYRCTDCDERFYARSRGRGSNQLLSKVSWSRANAREESQDNAGPAR
jgi:hypothetical protein